jgi:membrane fusion protein
MLDETGVDRVSGGRGPASSEEPSHRPAENEGFFRRESYETSAGGFGEPIAYLPLSWRLMSVGLVVFMAIAVTLAATYRYERKETARGVLRAEQGETQIFAPDRGVVRQVNVREGLNVSAGDILFTVSTDRIESDGGLPQADMLQALDAQEVSLRRRLTAITSTDALQADMSSAQLSALRASLGSARTGKHAAEAQLNIVRDDYERAKPIAEAGYISKSELKRRELAVISATQALSEADAAIARLEAQISEQRSDAATRPYSTTRERGQIEDALSEIAQRRAQYLLSRGYAIRAPVAGEVTALQASVGRLADPLKPMASIVPRDTRLQAILYVPSRGVGFLHPGQAVRLHYDAFPYQTFGSMGATVVSVSQTVLKPEEVEGAVRLEEPAYRVEAKLDRQTVAAFGQARALHSGMALSADIVLEKRSIVATIFEPLLARGSVR